MEAIYLDHNATAPMLPEVASAMGRFYQAGYANPASQHAAGRRARRLIDDARESIAQILGARISGHRADQLIFTSGGSEANNLALLGFAAGLSVNATTDPNLQASTRHVVTSSVEHPSVKTPAEELQRQGWLYTRLRTHASGVTDLDHLTAVLNGETKPTLVSLMLANSETGVMQPVPEAVKLAHACGVPVHSDGVPVVGKLPVRFADLEVDMLSVAAHKFHGPKGIGCLIVRYGVPLYPQILGGKQQLGFRSGTESVELILGMQAALEHWQREADQRQAHLLSLRQRFEQGLLASGLNLEIHGQQAERLPQTSNVAFLGLDRQTLLLALDMAGIACSAGSACSSGSSEPSPVLMAMGCAEPVVQSSLRFSFGVANTLEQIDTAVERIVQVCKNLIKK